MYLNIETTSNTKNKVIYKLNDVPVIRYGHFNARYCSRVSDLYNITKKPQLKHDSIIGTILSTITDRFDDIVTKDGFITQNIIYYEVPLIVDGVKFTLDIAVLLTSSLAKFDFHRSKEVAKTYLDAFNKGIIKFRKPVICIETIAIAIRTIEDNIRTYSDYNIIHRIKLEESTVSKDEFMTILKHIKKERSCYTTNAESKIEEVLA